MGLRDAGGLATTLREAIQAHPAITIITNDLTDWDISILQVLVSARKTATQAGKSLTLAAPPGGALRGTLVKAGLVGTDGQPRTADEQFWTGTAGHTKGRAA